MAAIAQRLAQFGEINGRHFLFATLLAMPIAGATLAAACRWAAANLNRPRLPTPRRWWRVAALGSVLIVLAGLHIADGMQAAHPRRGAERRAAAALRAVLDRALAETSADPDGAPADGAANDGAPRPPRIWGVGVAANLATEIGGEVRTSFNRVSIEEAAAVRPDLIVLPRDSGRSFDYDQTAAQWTDAGFRALDPPTDPRQRRVWDDLVALAPADAALARVGLQPPADGASPAPPRRR